MFKKLWKKILPKQAPEGKRIWMDLCITNWDEVVLRGDNPNLVPDLERQLVEKFNAFPAWSMDREDGNYWYGVELVPPVMQPTGVRDAFKAAGLNVARCEFYW